MQHDSAPRKKGVMSFPSFQLTDLLNPTITSCGRHNTLLAAAQTIRTLHRLRQAMQNDPTSLTALNLSTPSQEV